MFLFDKPLEELKEEDLEKLIGLPESQELDFKQEPWGKNDSEKKEMLRDIISFANASGGYILIGMKTDKEERAIEISGFKDAELEARRINESCLTTISERIVGLKIVPVPLNNGECLIVIFVPRSASAPHMFTYKDSHHQFWKRYGTQKNRMKVEEIKEAAQKTMNLQKTLEGFLEQRKKRILQTIHGKPYLVISATPLIVKDEFVDIFDPKINELFKSPPYFRNKGWRIGRFPLAHRPSLYGVMAYENNGGGLELEIFRNGYVEIRVPVDIPSFCKNINQDGFERIVMKTFPLCEYPVSFFYFVEKLYSQLLILEPTIIELCLFNATHLWLNESTNLDDIISIRCWSDKHLEIPPMQFPVPFDPEKVGKIITDRLWNAFGFNKAPLFNDEGKFTLG